MISLIKDIRHHNLYESVNCVDDYYSSPILHTIRSRTLWPIRLSVRWQVMDALKNYTLDYIKSNVWRARYD